MKGRNLILLTGITSFVGSSLLINKKFIEKYDIIGTDSKNYYKLDNHSLREIEISDFYKVAKAYKEITIIHLATFFSLSDKDKYRIIDSNVNYGKSLINKLFIEKIKIRKIIYTNSLFCFSDDDTLKNSHYTKSKIKFSNFLDEFCLENDIFFSEFFIDNTIGPNDKRKKIIPLIINSIIDEKENPLQNPDKFINMIDVSEFIKIIYQSIDNNTSEKHAVYSKFNYNLESVYNYLSSKINNKKTSVIQTAKNDYQKTLPKDVNKIEIDYNIEKTLDSIIKYLN
tara:strand:- start:232 stop:1080 length:849 start_codon:yes stop_codon:yes gene_type:complete